MSEVKFTPGPWRVWRQHNHKPEYSTTWRIDSSTRRRMAELTVQDVNSDPEWLAANPDAVAEHRETMQEVAANAVLMAAAPDLFEALTNLVRCVDPMFATPAFPEVMKNAKQALEKATTLLPVDRPSTWTAKMEGSCLMLTRTDGTVLVITQEGLNAIAEQSAPSIDP